MFNMMSVVKNAGALIDKGNGKIAWNCAAGLCPAGSPGGMSMYDSTDLREM